MGSQAQLAHLQEEEAGPERGSDWPQVTQPAYGSGKAGIWLFKPGLLPRERSLGMSSTWGKSSRGSQHFPDAEARKAGPPAALAAALRTTPGECGAPSGAAPVGTSSHHCLIRRGHRRKWYSVGTWSQTVWGQMGALPLTDRDLRHPVPQLLHL